MDIRYYDHIIWDWNGTLLADVDYCQGVINSMLAKRQLPDVSLEHYREIFGFPVIDYYKKLGFDFDVEPFENISTEFVTQYELHRDQCQLMPGAQETLNHISQLGLPQSVLSAHKQSFVEQAIDDIGLGAMFASVIGPTDHYAAGKVALGERFITRSNLLPSKVLLVGDTLHDAEVAAAIGTDCCLIPNGHQSAGRLARSGVPLVDSIPELVQG